MPISAKTVDAATLLGADPNVVAEEQAKYPVNPYAITPNRLPLSKNKAPVAPTTAMAPVVSTSKAATSDVTQKMADMNSASTGAPSAGETAPAPTPAPAPTTTPQQTLTKNPSLPDGYLQDQNGNVVRGTLPEENKAPTLTDQFSAEDNQFKSNLDALNKKSDDALAQYQSQVQQVLNGTFPLTPDQQTQIGSITQAFQSLITQQLQANKNYENAVRQAGISAGRNIYAPEIELGNVQSAINTGIAKVADLNGKMASAVSEARIAFQNQNFDLVNKAYDKFYTAQKDREDQLTGLHKTALDEIQAANDDLAKKNQQALEERKFQFDMQQELQKPITEASADARKFMYDLALKYPDAGISPQDTIEAATAKLKASDQYVADLAKTRAEIAAKNGKGISDANIKDIADNLFSTGKYGNNYLAAREDAIKYLNGELEASAAGGTASPIDQLIIDSTNPLAQYRSKDQQLQLRQDVYDKMARGNFIAATGAVLSGAVAGLPATQQQAVDGYIKGFNALDDIERMLSEYKAAGGNTGLFTGTEEEIINKLKKTGDPKLLDIGNRIKLAMVDYRHAVSGAAFTVPEDAVYQSVFPSIKGSETYNLTKIKSLRDSFQSNLRASLGTAVGGQDNYDRLLNLRDTAVKIPELQSAAQGAGYDPKDVEELVRQGLSASQIQDLISSPDAGSVDAGKKVSQLNDAELGALSLAMAKREGSTKPGTRGDRNNNPGNIKVPAGGLAVARARYGDPGVTIDPNPAADGGYFLKFSDKSKGTRAIATLLKTSYGNLPLDAALRKWSNGGYGAEILA